MIPEEPFSNTAVEAVGGEGETYLSVFLVQFFVTLV